MASKSESSATETQSSTSAASDTSGAQSGASSTATAAASGTSSASAQGGKPRKLKQRKDQFLIAPRRNPQM